MMKLANRLHCPSCKGRLGSVSAEALRCVSCDRAIPLVDGVADFVGGTSTSETSSDRDHADLYRHELGAAQLFSRVQAAAGGRWHNFLGDAIVFGCVPDEAVRSIVAGRMFRSLLVADPDMHLLQACRTQVAPLYLGGDPPIAYATHAEDQDIVRDAVADTVLGLGLLSGICDVRSFLTMVHRVLKPSGRAAFVVPNRRFYQALCSAIAEALVQWRARDGAWPKDQSVALNFLSQTRRLLIHQGDLGLLSGLREKHFFDIDNLQDLGQEVGFAATEMIPLDADPAGTETTRRICQQAGADLTFTKAFAPLVAVFGQPYFTLLGRQDSSASMLVWLVKAAGPTVSVFMHRPAPPGFAGPEAALAGMFLRWSIELLAHETPDGILLSVGGWCLCNTDILWIRIVLGDVMRCAPVWRPRPDVHEVLNQNGIYPALNTLCSGLASDLLFDGVHPTDRKCSFRFDIQITGGTIVPDQAPEVLVMSEPMVIAH